MIRRVPAAVPSGHRALQRRLAYALRGGVPEEEQAAFMIWLGEAFGFLEPPASLGTADKMVPWLFREWSRDRHLVAGRVLAIRDWWTSERVDLGPLAFVEADRAQKAWHRALVTQRKRAEIAVQLRGAVVLSFPDGSAWHVVPMRTTDPKTLEMLRAVGASLGHCYAKLAVLRGYLRGNTLYTLYDRRGEPHVTIATTPEEEVTDSKITGNVDIPTDSRWAPHTVALIEHLPLKWSSELLAIAPVELLERLAQDPDAGMRWGVAGNVNTPPSVLARLAQDPEWYVRQRVAGNVNTPPFVLTLLAQDPNAGVRREIAVNVNTPPSVLALLAQDPDANVRWGVAGNVNMLPSVLTRLAQDPNTNVRWGAARNINTPPAVLTLLAQDPRADVRQEVAANPNTPPSILTRLAQDPNTHVRQIAVRNINAENREH